MVESGFADADTVQRFLVSEVMQAQSAGRVVLVDEAGLLSTQQLDQLTKIARDVRARVLLVGDTKQQLQRAARRCVAERHQAFGHAGRAARGSAAPAQRSRPPFQPTARVGGGRRGIRVCRPARPDS